MDDFPDYDGASDIKSETQPSTPPVEIPAGALSQVALDGIMSDFILREGTDYGTNEVSYESKVQRVQKQMERGEIKIVFDPDSETVTLMTAQEWERVAR